jgi:tetratricopeptide (TPR) repeat protein
MALLALGRPEEAIQHLRIAVKSPQSTGQTSAQVHDNLGSALQSIGFAAQLDEAVMHHRRALEIAPAVASQVPEILGNLGLAFAGLGKWEEALESFERALHRKPQNPRVQLARAQMQLLLGDFESGLRNYEWRKQVHAVRSLPGKAWYGERIQSGETLLLYAEQGLGDTIQALRYFSWVQTQIPPGAKLVVEVQESLVRLAAALPGIVPSQVHVLKQSPDSSQDQSPDQSTDKYLDPSPAQSPAQSASQLRPSLSPTGTARG